MKRFLQNLISMLALLWIGSMAQATTYYVATSGNDSNPGTQAEPFQTIQQGISVAQNGDTVLVANGTYYRFYDNRHLDFHGKNFTLQSQGGAANCIIDCQQVDHGFIFGSGETAEAKVIGFTIRNGTSTTNGGGMSIVALSSPTVTDCIFTGNSASLEGGGIYVYYGCNPKITRCTFIGNSAAFGGGMSCGTEHSSPTVKNCVFIGNSATHTGGAMHNYYAENMKVINCVFTGNTADEGGGMWNYQTSLTVTNCIFRANRATSVGGGMLNYSSSQTITNCTFSGNTAGAGGGMINHFVNPVVTNCILWGDTGGEITDNPATLTYCNVQGYPATPDAPDANHNFGADPRFVHNPSPGADNQWGTSDDDYGNLRLQANSPSINAGTASAPSLPDYDLLEFVRIAGSAPDQGAYEFGSTPHVVADFYVDKVNGSDTTGNGTSAAPFQTVGKALALVSDPIAFTVIHVKANNYGSDRPRVTRRVRFVNWGNTGQARIGKP